MNSKNSITNDDSNNIKEISVNGHGNPLLGHKLNDLLEKAQNSICKIEYIDVKNVDLNIFHIYLIYNFYNNESYFDYGIYI